MPCPILTVYPITSLNSMFYFSASVIPVIYHDAQIFNFRICITLTFASFLPLSLYHHTFCFVFVYVFASFLISVVVSLRLFISIADTARSSTWATICTIPFIMVPFRLQLLIIASKDILKSVVDYPGAFITWVIWCGFLCLKYYRAPRYRMRYVVIVLVERRCTGCKINDLHFWKNNVY